MDKPGVRQHSNVQIFSVITFFQHKANQPLKQDDSQITVDGFQIIMLHFFQRYKYPMDALTQSMSL